MGRVGMKEREGDYEGWNWVEIDSLLADVIRIYKRKGHETKRGDFERVPIRKGLRYTAKCRGCKRRLNFEIVMGQVEPRGINASGIDYCGEQSTAKAKKGPR